MSSLAAAVQDFAAVARSPGNVVLGAVLQYTIMPGKPPEQPT